MCPILTISNLYLNKSRVYYCGGALISSAVNDTYNVSSAVKATN